MTEYAATGSVDVFAATRAVFEQGLGQLSGPDTAHAGHEELEDLLDAWGREVKRQALQDHLDLRSAREQVRPCGITGSDGLERTRVEHGHHRRLATVFGQVSVTRKAYRAPGATNVYPLDAELNLPTGLHSHGLARLACIEAVRGSFAQASEAVERLSGVRIGPRQLAGLVRGGAQDVASFYAHHQVPPGSENDVLVLTFDGKGVVVRPQALREATAKAAAQDGSTLGGRGARKRMAELACVHDLRPVPRTAADVLPRPGNPSRRPTSPRATGKWLTASITADIPDVIAAGFDQAHRRDPDHQRTWIALVDGNNTQIEAIAGQAERHQINVPIIVDLIHVIGYLWEAAKEFFRTTTVAGMNAARTWVTERTRMILQGQARDVAQRIRARAIDSRLAPAACKRTETVAGYLERKAEYLDYPTALANGWPIATGVIEGACRHLVKDRMDITGARWGLEGAQAVLTLKAITTSGDFTDYWAWHTRQEHHRRYQQDHQRAV